MRVEHRSGRRLATEVEGEVIVNGDKGIRVHVLNVSKSGVYVFAPKNLPRHGLVQLRLVLPERAGQRRACLRAAIAHSTGRGLGLEVDTHMPGASRALEQLILNASEQVTEVPWADMA
jgi:hypothetical protein